MKRSTLGRGRVLAFVAAAAVAAGLAASGATAAAAGGPVTGNASNGTYLALGDSVAFGYVPPEAVPAPNYHDQHSFVGYPEYLAQQLDERVFNAACPGETTTSFLDPTAINAGCENLFGTGSGYRGSYQLHVQYQGSQMEYALKYLHAHKHTQLITIDIGANDAFVCQATTPDNCASSSELNQLAVTIGTHLAAILGQLRSVYDGRIVVLTYYSLDYADPTQVQGTEFLNTVIAGAAAPFNVTIADGFTAFQLASGAGGDPCAAGLLIPLPDGTCNIHPSAEGQQVLAGAIANVVS